MKILIAIILFTLSTLQSNAAINQTGCQGITLTRTVTIAASGTKTAAIDLGCFTLVGIQFGAFTGTALTFEGSSATDGTFVAVKATTSGSALSYTVAQNTFAAIDPANFYSLSIIKLVSGSTEASERTLTLFLKGF